MMTEVKLSEEKVRKYRNIYISGPISGRERLEYIKHFKAAEDRLESQGYRVFNPAKVSDSLPSDLSHDEYMAICMSMLSICGSIYMLKGWKSSCGANREFGYAMGKGRAISYEENERAKTENGMEE